MSYEEEVTFDWKCTRCREEGGCCLPKVWKYCPYCASKLKIEVKKKSGDEV